METNMIGFGIGLVIGAGLGWLAHALVNHNKVAAQRAAQDAIAVGGAVQKAASDISKG